MRIPSILRSRLFLYTFVTIVGLELLSFASWVYPTLGNVSFFLILFAVLLIASKDLRIGVGIALVELIIASHGYLFSFQHEGLSVSLRMGIFLILFVLGILDAVKKRRLEIYNSRYFLPLLCLAILLFISFVRGMAEFGFGAAFLDGNGYVFFLLILPIWQALQQRDDLTPIIQMGIAGLVASVTKLLFILYTFSHKFWWMMPETYRWIRDTRVGEVTEILGSFWRIFFASQIYIAIGFVLVFLFLLAQCRGKDLKQLVKSKSWWATFLLLTLLFTSTLVSLSRSNWVGLIAAAAFMMLSFFVLSRHPFKQLFSSIAIILSVSIASFALIIGTILFPIPLPGDGFSARDIFGGRITSFTGGEAAVDSRFGLLPPMLDAIKQQPLLGFGFGKTLTYITKDPRILAENPTGEYTTSAFEWGYLEIIIKTGIIGLLAYLSFILLLCKESIVYLWKRRKQQFASGDLLVLGSFLGGIVLLATHAFSPYLNHPLGIGYLLFWSAFLVVLQTAPNEKLVVNTVSEEEILVIDQA